MPSKEVPPPGYSSSKPTMASIAAMFTELGAQDACIQLQELCISHLCKSAEAADGAVGDFLNPLFKENSIPQGTHDFDQLRDVATRNYLVATYAQLEKMLKDLIVEIQIANPTLETNWKSRDAKGGNLSPLRQLAENLPPAWKAKLVAAPEFKLLEYYRLVRVANSHVKDGTLAKAQLAFKNFGDGDFAHFSEYKLGKVPNEPDSLTFADYRLFTRAIKYYSHLLNDACAP